MKRPRLASVRALARCRLRLKYVDGTVFSVDMTPLIEDSPGLASLGDPDAFGTARIIPGEGWAVERKLFNHAAGTDGFTHAPWDRVRLGRANLLLTVDALEILRTAGRW